MSDLERSLEEEIMALVERNLKSIWDADVATYRRMTAEDCSFFEWYISPQRIDGLDFHLRELRVHRDGAGRRSGSS